MRSSDDIAFPGWAVGSGKQGHKSTLSPNNWLQGTVHYAARLPNRNINCQLIGFGKLGVEPDPGEKAWVQVRFA